MAARATIGTIWLAAVAAIVAIAFATRSSSAEVNPLGGVFIVVGCAVGNGLAVALIRSRVVLAITAVAGAFFASQIAWGVLHNDHSTAAVGVIAPPFVNGVVAVVGVALGAAIENRHASVPRT
jgi:hypothetical protein